MMGKFTEGIVGGRKIPDDNMVAKQIPVVLALLILLGAAGSKSQSQVGRVARHRPVIKFSRLLLAC